MTSSVSSNKFSGPVISLHRVKFHLQQIYIPVGCVPPTCRPYPSMHWVGGCVSQHALGGRCLPTEIVCLGEGVSAKGDGIHPSPGPETVTPPPVNRMTSRLTDRCKNITLRAVKMITVKVQPKSFANCKDRGGGCLSNSGAKYTSGFTE